MKVYMKPVKMISWTDEKGLVTPIKFLIKSDDGSNIPVKVDKILIRDEEKLAGNRMLLYKCQSIIGDTEKIFELKLEINSSKWYLSKI